MNFIAAAKDGSGSCMLWHPPEHVKFADQRRKGERVRGLTLFHPGEQPLTPTDAALLPKGGLNNSESDSPRCVDGDGSDRGREGGEGEEHRFESAEMARIMRNGYKEYKRARREQIDKVETRAPLYLGGSVFPEWIKQNALYTNVDCVIRQRKVREAMMSLPANRTPQQKEIVINWLMHVWKAGKNYTLDQLEVFSRCLQYEELKGTEVLATEGMAVYTMYVVVEGVVRGSKQDGSTMELTAGESFGDGILSLPRGNNSSSDQHVVWEWTMVPASTPMCAVMKLRRPSLDAYSKDQRDLEVHQAMRYFRSHPIFKGMGSRLDRLCHVVKRRTCVPGEKIIRQDEPAECVYFIAEGRCEVFKEITAAVTNRWPTATGEWEEKVRHKVVPFKLGELGVGEYFGERGIVRNTGRAATVVAAERTLLFSLELAEFLDLLHRATTVVESVYQQAHSYPSDEEILTLFGALRLQRRHEDVIHTSIARGRLMFRPGEDDVFMRQTELKSRDIHTLPRNYGGLQDSAKGLMRRESVIMATQEAKSPQTDRIIRLATALTATEKPFTRATYLEALKTNTAPGHRAKDIIKQSACLDRSVDPAVDKARRGGGGKQRQQQQQQHKHNLGRLLRIQDTLPALIEIKYHSTHGATALQP